MPEYRYVATDILTNNQLEDLPLYGVSATKLIGQAGNATGSFKLGTGKFDDVSLLTASTPGRVGITIERDGVPIWGGPIWSRTYQSQANVISMTMQSWESIFNKVVFTANYTRTRYDQLTLFKELIDLMQLQPGNNFQLDTSTIKTCGIFQDITIEHDQFRFMNDIFDGLTTQSNSFDYTINVTKDSDTGAYHRTMVAEYPSIGSTDPNDFIDLEYPGNITNYWWPENASKGGARFTGLGQGEGELMWRKTFLDGEAANNGYPQWDKVVSNKALATQNSIDNFTAGAAEQFRLPVVTPTFDIKSDYIPQFRAWNNLGVGIGVYIKDERFPLGIRDTRRMIGWQLTIADSDSVEMLKLTLAGAEDAEV